MLTTYKNVLPLTGEVKYKYKIRAIIRIVQTMNYTRENIQNHSNFVINQM